VDEVSRLKRQGKSVRAGAFFSTPGQPVNFPGMHLETTASHVISLVVGALMIVSGMASLIVNTKRPA
jgi:hypothetical protein